MKSFLRKAGCLAVAGIGIVLAIPASAQVSVAPTALFLTEQERFGGLYIANSSPTAQEVTIEFRFGYPAADSLGQVAMLYDDSLAASRFSIAQSVRAFPQRFILPPGETQVVRLTAEPTGTPDDGLYWTRVVTTSTPQIPFEDPAAADGIQTRVQFRLQQVTALFYRKGAIDIRLGLGNVTASMDSSTVVIDADIQHEGNGPFFGTVRLRLLDQNRTVVHDESQSIAVYVPERRRFDVVWPEAVPGTYTAEITLTSERSDLPQDQLTRLDPVTGLAQFTIPSGP